MRRAALAAALCAVAVAPAPAPAAPPDVSAPAAFVFQPATRDVVFARKARERRPIASTTKLMTALVALDELELKDEVEVAGYSALAAESVIGLEAGERMTFADLLRGLLLASGNDAAHALAVAVAGSDEAFVRRMNRRARELGLRNTRFANPIGLDDADNYSSAEDLVKMALLLRRNSFVREIMAQPRAVLRSGARERVVLNRNTLVGRFDYVTGVKTGRTLGAGYVLVGAADRNGVEVISAVLGTGSEAARDADTIALLDYGLERYRREVGVRARHVLARVPVADAGDGVTAPLVAEEAVRGVVRRGEKLHRRLVGVPAEVEGPLPAGEQLGEVEVVREDGEVVGSAALVTAREVPAPRPAERIRSWLSRPGTLLLLAFLVGCTVSLVLLRRRVVGRAGGAR